jgi:hypothetical protein
MVQKQKLEVHHRRPESLGGTDSEENISYVDPRMHKYFHILFGNLNAFQTRDELNEWCAPPRKTVICKYVGGSKVTKKGGKQTKKNGKREKAIKQFFKNMTFVEKIDYINSHWLDSSYQFYILSK